MKSRLVTNTIILTAFQKLSGHPNPLVALFTADEEIGSPASEDAVIAEAKNARLALTASLRGRMKILSLVEKVVYSVNEIVSVAAHSGGFLNRGAAL